MLSRLTRIILCNLAAAVIAGATMGILNVLIDLLRSNPDFKFYQLFSIAMWHSVVWFIFGAVLAFLNVIYYLALRKNFANGLPSYLIIYTFIACYSLLLSYFNIKLLPTFFSTISVIANSLVILLGALLLFVIIKNFGQKKFKKFPVLQKAYIAIICVLLASSQISNFSGQNNQEAVSGPGDRDRLNVILVTLDAVRSDHLGCYGYSKQTSPNIDQIASNGILFENAFAQSSHTIESVLSLFTAIYPSTHSVNFNTESIPSDLIYFPLLFKMKGYRTAAFSTITYVSSAYGYDKFVDEFFEIESDILRHTILSIALWIDIPIVEKIHNKVFKFSYKIFKSKYSLDSRQPEIVIEEAQSWISRNQASPFFLYLHLSGGHTPYGVPKEFEKKYFDVPYEKPVRNPPKRTPAIYPMGKQPSADEETLDNMLAQYDAKIKYHDDQIGVLVDFLKIRNLWNNTLLVITADHGEEFYDHYGWAHGHSLFDELIKVPLIFHCPELIPEGKRLSDPVEHVDVFPTISSFCDVVGNFRFPYSLDGKDMAASLQSQASDKHREFIFSETNYSKNMSACCLRTLTHKAIRIQAGSNDVHLFYDLLNDPLEQTNLYNTTDENIGNMFQTLLEIKKRSAERAFTPKQIKLDKNTREQLRSLGYIK